MDLRAVDQQFAEFEHVYIDWNTYFSTTAQGSNGVLAEGDTVKNRITDYHANFIKKVFPLWDELCLFYASATPAECADVRQMMTNYPELVAYLFRNTMPKYQNAILMRYPKMIITEEYLSSSLEDAIRMGLATVSIENCQTPLNPTTRSLQLTELVYQMRLIRAEAEPYLAAMAERSDPNPGKNGCKPMQKTLATLHRSALLKQTSLPEQRHVPRHGIFWIPKSSEDYREYYKDSAIGCSIGGLIIVIPIIIVYLLRRFGPVLLPGSSPDLPYIVGLVVLFGLFIIVLRRYIVGLVVSFGAFLNALRRELLGREKRVKIDITTEQATAKAPTEQCTLSIIPGRQTSLLSYTYKDDQPIKLIGVPNGDLAKVQQKLKSEGWVQTSAEKYEDRGYVEKITLTFQR